MILGAGYDSRTYRFAEALRDVRAFEVDLAPMSAIKRRKMARLLASPPKHVTYVEANLLDADLEQRLIQHEYDIHAATLLILSGVAPYLGDAAVAEVFAFVGRHSSPGSSIVFDYVFREMVEGDDSAHARDNPEAPRRPRRAAALWDPRRRRATIRRTLRAHADQRPGTGLTRPAIPAASGRQHRRPTIRLLGARSCARRAATDNRGGLNPAPAISP